MRGARPLTDQEIENVFNVLGNPRDKALFMLGCRVGLRISELLSLDINSVLEHGELGNYVTVAKKNTKGKVASRTIPLTNGAKSALRAHLETLVGVDPKTPLFKSTQSNKAISRIQAHKILKKAFGVLKLSGNCSSHSLRKTYCLKVHRLLGEKIEMTQVAMGHASLSSTAQYLQVDREKVEKAILSQD